MVDDYATAHMKDHLDDGNFSARECNEVDEDPLESSYQHIESDHEMSTSCSKTSTSDKSDNEASEREDKIDTIDLCSDEPDAESDNNRMVDRDVMPKDFVIMPETFTVMPGYLELPEVEDVMQEPTMSVTGSEDL